MLVGPPYLWRLWGGILFCLLRLLGAPRVHGGHHSSLYLGGHITCTPSVQFPFASLSQGHLSLDLVNEVT